MDEAMGVTFTPIFAGARKNDYSDTEPLNDTARALLQAEVNRLHGIFVGAVARNRGLSEEAVRATEAGAFFGENGIAIGFVDAVRNYDEAFGELQEELSRPAAVPAKPSSGEPPDEEEDDMSDPTASAGTPAQLPATAAQPAGGQVIELETARREGREAGAAEARAQAQQRAHAIRLACDLAGCPQRFGEFLDSELTAEQVGQKLLEERAKKDAEGSNVDGHNAGPSGAKQSKLDVGAIYRNWNRYVGQRSPRTAASSEE